VDAEAVRIPVAEIHEALAPDGRPYDAIDPRGACLHLVEHAEALKNGNPGRLQQQAGADRPGVGRALEHLNLMPGASEQRRGRQPGGPGSDDPHSSQQSSQRVRKVHNGFMRTTGAPTDRA
jgi:hypothetical protein